MWRTRGRHDVQTEFWWEDLKEIGHLYDLVIGGSITLKWILRKYNGMAWTGFICLMLGQKMASCEQNNEPSGSIKCRKFLFQMGTHAELSGVTRFVSSVLSIH
jgi:hypothetical protein